MPKPVDQPTATRSGAQPQPPPGSTSNIPPPPADWRVAYLTFQQQEIIQEIRNFFDDNSLSDMVELVNDLTYAWITRQNGQGDRLDMSSLHNCNQLYRAHLIVNLFCKLNELDRLSKHPAINHE